MGALVCFAEHVEQERRKIISGLEKKLQDAFYFGEPESVVALGREIHDWDPNNSYAYVGFAVRECLNRNYSEAIGYAGLAIEFNSSNREALLMKLDLVQQFYDPFDACFSLDSVRHLLMQAFSAFPFDEDVLERSLIISINILDDVEEARRLYDFGSARNPSRFQKYRRNIVAAQAKRMRYRFDRTPCQARRVNQ